jgi:hypothetical protein
MTRHLDRRTWLVLAAFLMGDRLVLANTSQKFLFRIQTKDGGTVGNILIEAPDVEAAKVKLQKRYPGCTILNVTTKSR